jgi:hypothetical protein
MSQGGKAATEPAACVLFRRKKGALLSAADVILEV